MIFDIPSRIYPIPTPTERRIVLSGTKYKEWFFSEQIWAFHYFLQAGLFLKNSFCCKLRKSFRFLFWQIHYQSRPFSKLWWAEFNSHKKTFSPFLCNAMTLIGKLTSNMKMGYAWNFKFQLPIVYTKSFQSITFAKLLWEFNESWSYALRQKEMQ